MSSPDRLDHVCAGGCLRIHLHNADIFQKMDATVRAIAELIASTKARATLIDFRDVSAPTTFLERYELGEMAGRYLPGRLIAVLLRPDQADRNQIGKTVALNRGALVEVFTESAPAEAWLQRYAAAKPAG